MRRSRVVITPLSSHTPLLHPEHGIADRLPASLPASLPAGLPAGSPLPAAAEHHRRDGIPAVPAPRAPPQEEVPPGDHRRVDRGAHPAHPNAGEEAAQRLDADRDRGEGAAGRMRSLPPLLPVRALPERPGRGAEGAQGVEHGRRHISAVIGRV